MNKKTKVFGIGFHKTATTSLANALYTLGYNVTGFFGVHDPNISENVYDQAFRIADKFDAAQDTPWPVLYRELDERYPGSKFILTVRPSNQWIKSVTKHFKNKRIPAHEWIYGVESAIGYEDVYLQRYEDHNREVLKYFNNRPSDLLVVDITKGDGWEKICPFLGEEIPPFDFPTQNSIQDRSVKSIQGITNFIKRKLLRNQRIFGRLLMNRTISSAFIRDIFHYHYAMFSYIWESINQISEDDFRRKNQHLDVSVRDILISQISEEKLWIGRVEEEPNPKNYTLEPSQYQNKSDVHQLWKEHKTQVRQYVANLTDEVCDSKILGTNQYKWEVFIHLTTYGTEQRVILKQTLSDFGVMSEEPTFIQFFGFEQ